MIKPLKPFAAIRIAAEIVQAGLRDAASGYQMYTEATFNKAAEKVSKATTEQEVVDILCVPDFYTRDGVTRLLNKFNS